MKSIGLALPIILLNSYLKYPGLIIDSQDSWLIEANKASNLVKLAVDILAVLSAISNTHAYQIFLTNSDLSFMAPIPSILQSMSWSPSTKRMFLTFVPTLTTNDEPVFDDGNAIAILK